MGSDMFMESRNAPAPPLDEQVRRVVEREKEQKAIIQRQRDEIKRLKQQSDADAKSIVTLTRERDAALAAVAETSKPLEQAKYGQDGYNQWGTRYSASCDECGSDLPTNMLGMGRCLRCGADRNPSDVELCDKTL